MSVEAPSCVSFVARFHEATWNVREISPKRKARPLIDLPASLRYRVAGVCTHREQKSLKRIFFFPSKHWTIYGRIRKDTSCTARCVAVSGLWDSLRSVKICRSPSSCGCHAIFIVFFNSTTERSQPSLTSQINGSSPRDLPPPSRHESIKIPACHTRILQLIFARPCCRISD